MAADRAGVGLPQGSAGDSLARLDGRITVTDEKVVVTENGHKTSTDVEDPAAAFLEHFGIYFRQSTASGVLRQL